jgi:hypothetical protein
MCCPKKTSLSLLLSFLGTQSGAVLNDDEVELLPFDISEKIEIMMSVSAITSGAAIADGKECEMGGISNEKVIVAKEKVIVTLRLCDISNYR